MSQPSSNRAARRLLPLILGVYLLLATLYAVFTPAWQAPDEPAHYNYVRYLAEQSRFPILQPGDYPAGYLEEIKQARFAAGMSIDPIRYEFHQPPLFYLLALPVYHTFDGHLLPMRLFSVALGGLLLLVIHEAVRQLAPRRPLLAPGCTAFVAFLPMHLALTAAVNNDSLAELLLAAILLLTIRYLHASSDPAAGSGSRLLVLLGITTGLGLLTKSSVYVALPLVVVAVAVRHLWLDRDPPPIAGSLKALALYLVPSLGLALPWWLRNIALYGGADFLGLGRHEQVVAGQLRTAEFIAQHGAWRLVQDFLATSFRSFWGQFGWMGVLLDPRLYQALAILSGLALAGFVLWASDARRRAGVAPWQRAAGGAVALLLLLALASYLWYNTTFLQHQGRYLFPGLAAIGLGWALGWHEALRRERALPLAAALLACAILLRLAGLLPNWPLLMLVGAAVALGMRRFLPVRLDPAIEACPYLLLVPLDLVCLFLFVVPQLRV